MREMSQLILTVTRGTTLLTMDTRFQQLKSLGESQALGFQVSGDDLISLSQNINLDHKYFGSNFSNSWKLALGLFRFIVDKRVDLVGAGFFGPRLQGAKFLVTLRLEILWMDQSQVKKKILAFTEKQVEGIKDEIFNVDFDTPVQLDPSALKYTLVFKLDGPETMGLDPLKMKSRDCVEGVSFFFWPGSQQMPTLRFTKPPNPL